MLERLITYLLEKPLICTEDHLDYEQLLEEELDDCEIDLMTAH